MKRKLRQIVSILCLLALAFGCTLHVSMAEDGDVIVLAGKGHETYQEIKGVKYPFDEKQVVADLLREMEG